MAKSNENHTQSLLSTAKNLARETCADMILLITNSGVSRADVHKLNNTCPVLIITRNKHFLSGFDEPGVQRLAYDYRMDEDDGAHFERVRRCVIRGMEDGYISRGARLVCLSRMLASRGVDAITVMDTRVGFDVYDPAQISFIAGDLPLKVVKTTLDLAINIGKEGREGEPVGTLFVIGDSKRVLHHSRSMTFDPFRGYSDKEKNICNPDCPRRGQRGIADGWRVYHSGRWGYPIWRTLYFGECARSHVAQGIGCAACGGSGDYQIHPSYRPGCFRVNRNGPALLSRAKSFCKLTRTGDILEKTSGNGHIALRDIYAAVDRAPFDGVGHDEQFCCNAGMGHAGFFCAFRHCICGLSHCRLAL